MEVLLLYRHTMAMSRPLHGDFTTANAHLPIVVTRTNQGNFSSHPTLTPNPNLPSDHKKTWAILTEQAREVGEAGLRTVLVPAVDADGYGAGVELIRRLPPGLRFVPHGLRARAGPRTQ